MKNKVNRLLSIMLALFVLFSNMVPVHAADVMEDQGKLRYQSIPDLQWYWSNGAYTGQFDIVQYTNTNYYFTLNSNNKIYYSIDASSVHNKECRVETYCLTCNREISEYAFYPNSTPFHRSVTVASTHTGHYFYFKIIAFDGGSYFSDNDIAGTIKVGSSYV